MHPLTPLRSILALASLVLSGWAQTTPLEAARQELRSRTADEVEALADWCHGHRLYLERDRLYRALLELEPEHREARRHLRYRRSKAGWEALPYSAPLNRAPEFLGEFHGRRVELEGAWRAGLGDLALRFEDELDERARRALADELLVLVPDDAETRERRGEVADPLGGGWILRESALGRARRAELEARAAELRRSEPRLEHASLAPEDAFLPWKERLCAPEALLSATGPAPEAARIVGDAMVAVELFRAVLGEAPVLAGEVTVFAFDRQETLELFLAHPLQRSLAGAAVDQRPRGIRLAIAAPSAEARREEALRQVLERMFRDSFGLGEKAAWARAGLVRRWDELVRGELAAPADGRPARRNAPVPAFEAARALLASDHAPALAQLLEKPSAELSPADELVAYALVRYCLESARPAPAVLFDELGRAPERAEAVLARQLGFELAELEARLVRWVAESGAAPQATKVGK